MFMSISDPGNTWNELQNIAVFDFFWNTIWLNMRNRLNQGKVVQTWGYNFKNIRNATDLNTIYNATFQ